MLLSLLLAVDAALQPYVRVDSRAVVLEHVRVIDGTGAPAREDQTLYLVDGKIAGQAPVDAQRLDLQGRTVMPGLVGMHDHLFYPMGGGIFGEMAYSFPRLYLAAGVTTIRTAGSIEPYTDIELKKAIDAGKVPGPTIWITGPYLEGQGSFAVQLHALKDPDEARKFVNFWADQGATSFKAYNTLTRAELGAAIQAAHKRGLKLTAHLCSIGSPRRPASGSTIWSTAFWSTPSSSPPRNPTSARSRARPTRTWRRCRRPTRASPL